MPALVVEGGASRAAYATGVLASLQSAGLVPDAIYGTSAGGALAAWYAAGQMELACRTWDSVEDRKLWSYRRLLKNEPVLQLGLLYRHYYPNVFGLDVGAVRRASYPVIVTVTDADTAETLYVDLRCVDDPMSWVHAGAALPVLSDGPVLMDGRRLVDGGATDPIPLRRAMQEGHRDIVVALNREAGEREAEPAWAVRLVGRRFPALAALARTHHERHNAAVALAEHPPAGIRVRIVRPARDTRARRTTRDAALLRRVIETGREDGANAAREMGVGVGKPT